MKSLVLRDLVVLDLLRRLIDQVTYCYSVYPMFDEDNVRGVKEEVMEESSVLVSIVFLYVRSPEGHILLQSRKFFFFRLN